MNRKGFSTAQTVIIGFIIIIMIGAVILSLPVSSSEGKTISFIDAFFTSVTSVCVIGLSTVTIAEQFSLFGQIVILLLIQLGGLGVVCCGIGVLLLLRQKISMRERVLIQSSYNLTTSDGLVGFVQRIIKGTFVVEGIGMILYSAVFIPEYGLARGVWYSLFHAVSAFCNAGIDIIGGGGMVKYQENLLINAVTIFLAVVGGIGFIVWWDIMDNFSKAREQRRLWGSFFRKLTLHSKLAIVTTIILLAVGTVLIFAFEYTNQNTIGNLSFGQKWISAFFESMTTRTVGFAMIPQENFRDTTYLLLLILMLIGGSPLGTAGGVKTTTVAMLFLAVRSEAKGYKDVEAFHRKISSKNIRTGLAIVLFAISAICVGTLALLMIEGIPLRDAVFQCVAIIGTAGLCTGSVADFSVLGKLAVCCLMFAGRLGAITIVMAFAGKKDGSHNRRECATAKIMLG